MRLRLVATAIVPFFAALAAIAACAAPTEAILTIQSSVDCGEMSVEIYTGADLAAAQKKAATPNFVPDAEFRLRPEKVARPLDQPCTQTALENLGTLALHPKSGTSTGALVAIVKLKNSAAIGDLGPEAAIATTRYLNRECTTKSPLPANCLRIEATFAYQKNVSRSFPLRISQACFGKRCEAGTTCFDGECIGTERVDDKPVEVEAGVPDSGPPPAFQCVAGKPVVNGAICAEAACQARGASAVCSATACAKQPGDQTLCCSVAGEADTCCIGKSEPQLPYTQSGASCDAGAKKACFKPGSGAAVGCAANERCAFNANVGFGRCKALIAAFSCPVTRCQGDNDDTCIDGTSGFGTCGNYQGCTNGTEPCCVSAATNCCVQLFNAGVAPVDFGNTKPACLIGQPCFVADNQPCAANSQQRCRHFKTADGDDAGYGICE